MNNGIQMINDHRPVDTYYNGVKIAGSELKTFTGTSLSIADTYNDTFSALTLSGRYEQTKTVQGKNLLPYINDTMTIYGVNFTRNHDCSVTINGTATNNIWYPLTNNGYDYYTLKNHLSIGTYYLSQGASSQTGVILQLTIDDGGITRYPAANTSSFAIVNGGKHSAYIKVNVGTVVSNLTLYPQLELGTTATPYEPFIPNSPSVEYPSYPKFSGNCKLYAGSSEIDIPTLRSLPDGTSDYIEIDSVNNKFKLVQNVGELVLNGSEPIDGNVNTGSYWRRYILPTSSFMMRNGIGLRGICSHFRLIDWAENKEGIRFGQSNSAIYFTTAYETAVELRSWFASQYALGKPVTIEYPLATPIITNLTPINIETVQYLTRVYDNGILPCDKTATLKVFGRTE